MPQGNDSPPPSLSPPVGWRDRWAFILVRDIDWKFIAKLWEPAAAWGARLKAAAVLIGGALGVVVSVDLIWRLIESQPDAAWVLPVAILSVVLIFAGRFKRATAVEQARRFIGLHAVEAIIVSVRTGALNMDRAVNAPDMPTLRVSLQVHNTCPFDVLVHMDSFEVIEGSEADEELEPVTSSAARRDILLPAYETATPEPLLFPLGSNFRSDQLAKRHSYYSYWLAALRYVISVDSNGKTIAYQTPRTSPASVVMYLE